MQTVTPFIITGMGVILREKLVRSESEIDHDCEIEGRSVKTNRNKAGMLLISKG